MEYRRLGRSGLKLSVFSFGSWVTFSNQVDQTVATQLLARAYERGVNFFDNAEAYADGQSEILMGAALKKLGWGRDTFCVSSKVFWGGDLPTQNGLSRKHVFDACHAALKRLQVDYLDLYYCHRPDLDTPIDETVAAMTDLVRQGKILYWGTSEWSAQQITEAFAAAAAHHLVPPTMEQSEYNLFNRQKLESEYLPLFKNFGLGATTWSPLASGVLTGKYNKGLPQGSRMTVAGFEWLKTKYETPEGKALLEKARKLGELADSLDIPLAQLSLAWCLKNPNVSTVILGASRIEQLEQNLDALDIVPRLTPEVLAKIETCVDNRPAAPERF